jgi:hypothetical protein
MEKVRTSETSVNFYETTHRNIPKDGFSPPWEPETLQCSQYLLSSFRYKELKWNARVINFVNII